MKAFITGISGQDGRYLADLLLGKGYEVYGLVRRTSQPKVIPPVNIVESDITDPRIIDVISEIKPDEVYNLAAMSHVGRSFDIPTSTFMTDALGASYVLEGARKAKAKFYQASTSELFGLSPPPHNEKTPFYPRSPYGVAKLAAYWMTVNYRESYGLYACNGILFNHESPLRGEDFVTQKIAQGVSDIFHGLSDKIVLGNLDAKRDFGHAKDFVYGMWLMLQQDTPDDYVLSTGETHSIREVLDVAFSYIGICNWSSYIEIDPKFFRPADVPVLLGDYSKAREKLGWSPKYSFKSLIEEMVHAKIQTNRAHFRNRQAEDFVGSRDLERQTSRIDDESLSRGHVFRV